MNIEVPLDILELMRIQDVLIKDNGQLDPNFETSDFYSLANEMVRFVRIRPFHLGNIVDSCLNINSEVFREQILCESIRICPVIAYHLHKAGYFTDKSVYSQLCIKKELLPSLYFYRIIPNFFKFVNIQNQNQNEIESEFNRMNENLFSDNCNKLISYIENGFLPSSVAYSVKFDDIESFKTHSSGTNFNYEANIRWSIFEWSIKPVSLSCISFAAHFGSVRVFKYLISNGAKIDENVFFSSVSSGNMDIIHICQSYIPLYPQLLQAASFFFHHTVYDWIFFELNTISIHCLLHSNVHSILTTMKFINAEDPSITVITDSFNPSFLHKLSTGNNVVNTAYRTLESSSSSNVKPSNNYPSFLNKQSTVNNVANTSDRTLESSSSSNVKPSNYYPSFLNKQSTVNNVANTSDRTVATSSILRLICLSCDLNPIHHYTIEGNINLLRYFFRYGFPINPNANNLLDPLSISFIYSNPNTTRFLIEKGASLITGSIWNSSSSSLDLAIKYSSLDIIKTIMSNFSPNDLSKANPLHIATQRGSVEIIEYFCGMGYSLFSMNHEKERPIDYLNFKHHRDAYLYVFEKARSEDKRKELDFLLFNAIESENIEEIEFLLANEIDINIKNDFSETPLHLAVSAGFQIIVEYLVSAGAMINAQDAQGNTPIMLSVKQNLTQITSFLITCGADLSITDCVSNSLLHISSRNGQYKVVEQLLSLGSEPNVRNGAQYTPLHAAAQGGFNNIMGLLLQNGANMEARSYTKMTPFLYSIESDNIEAVKFLVSKECQTKVHDHFENSGLHISGRNGNKTIYKYLLDIGLDPDEVNKLNRKAVLLEKLLDF